MFLREWGILKESDGLTLSKIIINVSIPALIISALSTQQFEAEKLLLALVMVISQVSCALIAWVVSWVLKLSRPRRGALILASTFTSSAFLGYAVVKEAFHNNAEALADAAIVSELGVATLLFTMGIFIAMYFGNAGEQSLSVKIKEMIKFFYSSIFVALVIGIVTSFIEIPHQNIVVSGVYKMLGLIANANTFMVAITIGVMLHFKDLRKVWGIVMVAVLIKLIIQPLLSHYQAGLFNFPDIWREIVVLEAAMPTAAMTAVFAKRYGCDAELTSILIFATFISSCITMIMMVLLI
jgi:predicted permease